MEASNLNGTIERQQAFRAKTKIAAVVKGSSALNLLEFNKYDTSIVHDELAKRSKKVALSNKTAIKFDNEGDQDVWVEKLLTNSKTGEKKVYFVSKQTGQKVAGEPPSGASRVLYLKSDYKATKLSEPARLPVLTKPREQKNKKTSPTSVAVEDMKKKFLDTTHLVTPEKKTAKDIYNSDACLCPNNAHGRPRLERSRVLYLKSDYKATKLEHASLPVLTKPREQKNKMTSPTSVAVEDMKKKFVDTNLVTPEKKTAKDIYNSDACLCPHDAHGRPRLERACRCQGILDVILASDSDSDDSLYWI